MKVTVYLITFFTAMLGTLVSLFLLDTVTITQLGNMTQVQLSYFLSAVMWFIIALITYVGVKKTNETGFSFISLDFLFAWLFCDVGVVLGTLIYILLHTGSLTIQSANIITVFLQTLPLAIGPTGTAALGLHRD